MENNIRYAMQLSLLKQLFDETLITIKEYTAIKIDLKNRYKIN